MKNIIFQILSIVCGIMFMCLMFASIMYGIEKVIIVKMTTDIINHKNK